MNNTNIPPSVAYNIDESKLGAQIFERFSHQSDSKKIREDRQIAAWNSFGKEGRDPEDFKNLLSEIVAKNNWDIDLKIAKLRNQWGSIVGEAVAQNSSVVSYDESDGSIVIHSDSPVWQTQLQYLIPQIREKIQIELPGLHVGEIRITGANTRKSKNFARRHNVRRF